jgi:amidohydrolase
MIMDFYREAHALEPDLVARRRDLHRHPETAFEESRTAGIVTDELRSLSLEVQTGVGKTGIVALLEGERPGPTILVRADMDALPILEENQTDYVSTVPGKMHACGHDGHTSIALAVARILSQRRANMHGRIRFVFQPAEEVGGGARAMIADGVLENPRPDFALGLHLWNNLPVGQIAVTSGPMMSAADDWGCVISGRGGHGAIPHQTIDPIAAAAHIITALQTIVSRNVDPLDTAVVTVGSIQGGTSFNIIPPTVSLRGTLRTYRRETQALVRQRLREICEGVAASLGCSAEVQIDEMTVAVDNDPALSDRVAALAADLVGPENVRRDVRTMGSEDMSYLMNGIPGCFFFIGSANADRDLYYGHHHPRFDFDERALVTGTALLAAAAASFVLPEG